MIHLTDEQLNEYLDNEITESAQIEAHLSSCEECVARLTVLRNLFDEIESLPDLTLSHDIAASFARQSNLPILHLPRWLTLTATLQAAIAMIVLMIAAPFVIQFFTPYLSSIQIPAFEDMLLQLQSQWTIWLNLVSQFQMPVIPEIPVIELSSLVILLILASVSALWLVGNGLLLRNQIK
jgi:predicted anti-sigma-YlaC factor YlaD